MLQSDGTTLLVTNPLHHMNSGTINASSTAKVQTRFCNAHFRDLIVVCLLRSQAEMANEKLRQLDSEFGGERYGKVRLSLVVVRLERCLTPAVLQLPAPPPGFGAPTAVHFVVGRRRLFGF